MILFRITLIVVLAGLPLACGDKKKPSTKSEPATASVLAPFELKVDPGDKKTDQKSWKFYNVFFKWQNSFRILEKFNFKHF